MAATEFIRAALNRVPRRARRLIRLLPRLAGLASLAGGGLGGALVSGATEAAELPEDRADVMVHVYDGGGVRASGPAFLVRKSLASRVSLAASYYVDLVSNASIDVVTTASPYREQRTEQVVSLDAVVRDASISLAQTRSREPDYKADSVSLDVTQEVFGGMTTVALGYTHGLDRVSKRGSPGPFDRATHRRYRLGATQVLTPRLRVSADVEALADEGFLGSPYRAARVFGAAVPERVPRTRSTRAIKLGAVGDFGPRAALHAEYRYTFDTWDLNSETVEVGVRERFGRVFFVDGYVRLYAQNRALFYSDNASAESEFVSRNRQLSTFRGVGGGVKLAYAAARVAGRYDLRIHGAYERTRYTFEDFTDSRSGSPYAYNANVLQLSVSATF